MRISSQISTWVLPVLLTVAACIIALLSPEMQEQLRYERAGIAAGEVYRLLSGHFAHLGLSHLLLNVAGLFLVWYLVGAAFTAKVWSVIILLDLAIINAGFWWLQPMLEWYVGLSGLLHGMLLAGAVGLWRTRRVEAAVIILAVCAKLVYESLVGPLPGTASAAGGTVITAAHLYGGLGGLASGLGFSIRVQPEAAI